MANQPTSFRYPFNLDNIEGIHPTLKSAIRYTFTGLKDLNDAIKKLNDKTQVNTTAIATMQAAASAVPVPTPTGPLIFTRGGTILTPTAPVNMIVWYAPFAATVTNVLGYTSGSTGSTINAQLNGSLKLLVGDLTLSSADTWMDGGAVQNQNISVGDKLEIMLVSLAGSPTEISIEIQCTRP